MTSIRRRLLVILLSSFALAWAGLMYLSTISARQQVEKLFDAQLAQSAYVLLGLVLHEMKEERADAAKMQAEILSAGEGRTYRETIAFQIWRSGQLLLRSPNSPSARFTTARGFSDTFVDDDPWRVYVTAETGGLELQVGERYELRNALVREILLQMLWPALIILPLLSVLIWTGVSRGLRPLQRVAREIAQRSPQQLQPLSQGKGPDEVQTLVDSLNDLLQRLDQAFERERRFTASAAHELRTPLAGLKAQAQVALRAAEDSERERALRQIVRGVDRATHLVEQMLTLARIDPEQALSAFQVSNLSAPVNRVVSDLRAFAADKQIAVELDLPAELKVRADTQALAILARNVLDNAIRYTPKGGHIRVRAQRDEDVVVLSVSDDGPGIPPDLREQVFARFFRVLDGQSSGCGLGLSIVRRIAELHGARVRLQDSPYGRGLQVRVEFPPAPDDAGG